jgi:uncharacterized protein YlzI (FlbEa/FlbD family)
MTMKLIELTEPSGYKVTINADHIVMLSPDKVRQGYATLVTLATNESIQAKETVDEIKDRISQATDV